ncbi:Family with sequence similarity 108, member [Seminavis robusta]|uniref:Family with sequence similarity 108, member n=1 Tax=Seminavis robusta TaxID=568900 RepID=A0A9N8D5C9_9STRA|nr:Family with sequence similarity 108, member [Seminavis robusta]|eukprot:Sro9_g007380.1 Family with sequence similarity 108, member (498) ;mRNA; f:132667-134160
MSGTTEEPQQPGLRARISQNIEMARKGYEQLVNAVIRPPRAQYAMGHLGPAVFTFLGQRFRRDDIILDTDNMTHPEDPETEPPRPLKLQASLWTREGDEFVNPGKPKTMVVYLHGNASARVEVLPQLSFLLASGIFGVCSLDFTGSGQSDGEYVSLGYYERFDLECVLQYLQNRYRNLEIVLWGRSMGASTALMHASEKTREHISVRRQDSDTDTIGDQPDPDSSNAILKGLICDSPFASLPQLCEELVEKAKAQGVVVPSVIVSVAIAMIARSVWNRAHFPIKDIAPVEHAPTIDTPALFVVGADDDFIPPHHSEDICAAYQRGISTNLLMVPGGHNDARPQLVFDAAAQFLKYRLSLTEDCALPVPDKLKNVLHTSPPWAFHSHPDIFQVLKNTKTSTTSFGNTTTAEAMADEFGMTQQRQDDIQDKIHLMLGQQQPAKKQATPAPADSPSTTSTGSTTASTSDTTTNGSTGTAQPQSPTSSQEHISVGVPISFN